MKAALVVSGMCLTGCAALIPTPTGPGRGAAWPAPVSAHPALQGLHDVRGAMELHSRHSHDGTMPIATIARLAGAAGLDFVVITDHNTLAGHAEERREGRPLVLVGSELSTTGGHLLALFMDRPVTNDQPVEQIVEAIHAQGGLAIVSDPTSRKTPWTRWDLPVDGLAIFDLNDALLTDGIPWLLLKAALLPNATFWHTVRRRPAVALAVWDAQLQRGRHLTGTAGHDTHAHAGVAPVLIDSFQSGFRLMATHVLVPALTPAALADGLRRGRVYVGFDGAGDPRPFLFTIHHQAGWAVMGDRVPWAPGLSAVIQIPRRATIRLYHDGRPLRSTVGTTVEWPIERPGVYRIEVSLNNRPWMLSNPIYVDAHEE
ncbi:MAG: CehA/McbA family metallohydrolase [Candidatus Omnitrophica bacterium]|nr:CehA/McbA family metallohydrolase [Candidatus Omnitrophota bacterium]